MSVDPLQPFLQRQQFVMLDGGLATEMERHGADLDDPLWSARMLFEQPDLVRRVHSDFLKAGADVVATATYQASHEGFANAGYTPHQAESLLRLGVDLAVLAREAFWSGEASRQQRLRPLVAASIGPYGAILHDGSEYHGNYGLGKQELIDFHRPRMEVLADTDADLFAFETIPSLLEAEALLELLGEFPDKRGWLSFSCRDGEHVCHGERFADGIALASASDQIVAAGLNCTPPGFVGSLLDSLQSVTLPLAVYPNSGEDWDPDGNRWTGEADAPLHAAEWYEKGARLLGGCCRISAGAIGRIRDELTEHLHPAATPGP